jgi:hypothetical protein
MSFNEKSLKLIHHKKQSLKPHALIILAIHINQTTYSISF